MAKKKIFQTYPHFYEKMNQFLKENETITSCDVCFVGDSQEHHNLTYRDTYKNKGFLHQDIYNRQLTSLFNIKI